MSDVSPNYCDLKSCDFFKQLIIKLWGPRAPSIIETLGSMVPGPCPFCTLDWANPPALLREESLFTWAKLMNHLMLCPSQTLASRPARFREDILISWPFIDLLNLVFSLPGSDGNYYSNNQAPLLTIDRTSPPTLIQAVTRHMIQCLSQEVHWQETRNLSWRVAKTLCLHPRVLQLKRKLKGRKLFPRPRMQKERQY